MIGRPSLSTAATNIHHLPITVRGGDESRGRRHDQQEPEASQARAWARSSPSESHRAQPECIGNDGDGREAHCRGSEHR